MEASQAQLATDIALIAYLLIIFGSGTLSDKVGRRRMLLTACVAFIVLSIPCFLMLGTASLPIVIVAELIMCVTLSLNDANIACYQAEMFPHGSALHGSGLGVEHCLTWCLAVRRRLWPRRSSKPRATGSCQLFI